MYYFLLLAIILALIIIASGVGTKCSHGLNRKRWIAALCISSTLLIGVIINESYNAYRQHQSAQAMSSIEENNRQIDAFKVDPEEQRKEAIKDIRKNVKEDYGLDITDADAYNIFASDDKELIRLSTNRIVMVRHLSGGDIALF